PGVVVTLRRTDRADLRDRRLLVRRRHRDLAAESPRCEVLERTWPRRGVGEHATVDHRRAGPRCERQPGIVRRAEALVVGERDLGAVRLEDVRATHRLDGDLAVRDENVRLRIVALVDKTPL